MVWFSVVVSTEWKNTDFNQFRALYRYRWGGVCICGGYGEEGEGKERAGKEDETPSPGAII